MEQIPDVDSALDFGSFFAQKKIKYDSATND